MQHLLGPGLHCRGPASNHRSAQLAFGTRRPELAQTLFLHHGLKHRARVDAYFTKFGYINFQRLHLNLDPRDAHDPGQGAAPGGRYSNVLGSRGPDVQTSLEPLPGGALVGASAKQLWQTAEHSSHLLSHSVDEYDNEDSLDDPRSLDETRGEASEAAGVSLTYTKANHEVLRLDDTGAVRRLHVKRRDLLREYRLQPRDLRRIDPSIDAAKTSSPSITIKENSLLLNLGGIRAIVTAEKVLLFEPNSVNTRKLLSTIVPRLQAAAGHRLAKRQAAAAAGAGGGPDAELYRREAHSGSWGSAARHQPVTAQPPFELEVLEGVLMVATGRLDAEVLSVTRRVSDLLTRLPADINPVNLEELRRLKGSLVELEDKAGNLRELLEQLMDDEDELAELNLSSRPAREERRRQRERERLERELERARGEMERSSHDDDDRPRQQPQQQPTPGGSGNGRGGGGGNGRGSGISFARFVASTRPFGSAMSLVGREGDGGNGGSGGNGGITFSGSPGSRRMTAAARRERLAELYAKHGVGRGGGVAVEGGEVSGEAAWRRSGGASGGRDGSGALADMEGREREAERWSRDNEDEFQDAADALEEMADAEEEERELEEVEDLLGYYLQRASATQSEAERLLEGARDLEESIGVSLSARRYEVVRVELMLSMGSFSAALGAMIAGIFGMNMRSMLELSVAGFWGVTAAIVGVCVYVFLSLLRYTRQRRIL